MSKRIAPAPHLTERFIADIVNVCRTHGLSLSHEDTHGAFKIAPYGIQYETWLRAASFEDEPPYFMRKDYEL